MSRIFLEHLAILAAAALCLAGPVPSLAQDSGKASAKAAGAPTVDVTVFNRRSAVLTELDVATAGSPSFKPFARKIAAGQKAIVKFPKSDNCQFDLHASFADGTSQDNTVDICLDGKITFVE